MAYNSCAIIAEVAELKVSLLETTTASVSARVAEMHGDIDSFPASGISAAQDMVDAAQEDITDTLGFGSDLSDDLSYPDLE